MSGVLKALRHPWFWAISSFVVGVGLSLWVSDYWQAVNETKVQALVAKEADRIADAANQRVLLYDNGLSAVRTHVLSSQFQLNRTEFHSFVESLNLPVKFPGARGFGVIVRVPLEEEPTYVAKARRDGIDNFAIRQFKANALDRYVIQYVEPIENNRAAVGLDIGSESARREAAEQSIESGQIRITAPITLVQASNKQQQSFLILLPIYRSWETPSTPDARRAQTKAWAYAPLLMSEILAGVRFDKENFSVQFQDIDTKEREVFYKSETNGEQQLYTQERVLPVYGRHWMITVSASQHYVISLGLMTRNTTLTICVFISLIASVLAGMIAFNRRQGSQMANQTAVMNAIVNSANDAIIATDLDGKIIAWNPGAAAHFGYTEQEAIGKSKLEFLVPDELRAHAIAIYEQVFAAQKTKPFISRRKSKSGALIDVLETSAPVLDEDGKITGICFTLSNISELKNIERDLVELTASLELRVQERTKEVFETKRSLELLLNAVPVSISQWTRYQTHVISNSACQQSLGVSVDSIKSQTLRQLWSPLLLQQYDELVRGVLAGRAQTTEYTVNRGATSHTYLLHMVPDFVSTAVVGFYVIELDISRLAESQHLLHEAQRETQALLGAINQQFPYSVTDLDGNIIEVNDQFCLVSGYSREEILSKSHRIFNSGNHSRKFWDAMWREICDGKTWRGEICNRTKSGDLVWLDTVISPTYDSNGRPLHFIALCSDVTARKKAEAAREELSRYLQDVMSASSQVAIIATDLEGTITLFNRGAENLLGYKAEELVGKFSPAVFHKMEEVVARGQELSAEAGKTVEGFNVFSYKLAKGETETRRWTYIRKDGTEFPVSLSTAIILNGQADAVGYVGIATDITQTLAFEHEIASVRDQLNIATQVAKLGVWTWDVATNQLWWNDRMYEIYEQPDDLKNTGLVYSHWRDRVHRDDVVAAETLLHAAVQGTANYDTVFRLDTPSQEKYVLAGAQIDRDEQGVVHKVTGINLDITDQRLLELRLRMAKEAADQASQAKSQFLANMSHEIRTPMNAVLGMLQLMGHTQLNAQQDDYVHKAHSAAKSLLDILNDILDFSKIDAGKLQLDPVEFDLEELLRDLSVVLSGNHKNKTVEVLFELDANLPSHLVGDRLRLQQVLVNLASNALKFTAEGFVKIHLSLNRISNQSAAINFSVEDSGIGISSEQQLKLFQSFSQAETSTTRRFGGTGLGLVISKRLVELMGAELCIDSKVGEGSRFFFDITLPIANQTLLNSHPLIEAKPIRILVVDDSPLQRQTIAAGLSSFGWAVDTAADGNAALEKISRVQNLEQAYQLILLDWYMPQMDGLAAARALRNEMKITTPIIALPTGFERQKFSELSSADLALFADSVVKPATPKQLAESIWQTLFGRFPKQEIDNQKPLQGLQLLVVEDNELNRQVALELLENAGAKVTLAEGGLEGVHKVTGEPHSYDLVIMDLQMPDIDGLEATRRIRQDARFNHLPILAMTANVTPQDRQQCLDAGMNDHIGKPINMELVIPSILVLAGRAKPAQIKLSTDTEQPIVLLENLQQVLSRFGGNKMLYEKMLTKFAPEIRTLQEKYARARAANDLPTGVIAVHSMKGVSATMGASALSKSAAYLEKQGKAGQWASPTELQALETLITQTIQAFNETLEPTPEPLLAANIATIAITGDLLGQLIEELKDNNMAALATAEQLAQTAPASARLKELNGAIQNLEFESALLIAQSLSNEIQ